MSAKVRKPSARSIRYLLSGDRRLQKLSLRRMSALAKTARKPARSRASDRFARVRNLLSFPWTLQSRAIALAAVFVLGVAALIGARQSSSETSTRSGVDAQAARHPIKAASLAAAPDSSARTSPAVLKTGAAASDAKAHGEPSAPVMITGCLVLENDSFWLKDASGADAPKTRSWKTGFMKKHAAPIAVVDAAHTLKLSTHVGQRVSASGVLANGEMRARALQPVAASCG